MSLSPTQRTALYAAVDAARAAEVETECPAELTLPQFILESAWGAKAPGNNGFGIKRYDGCYGIQMLDTWEVVNGKKHFVRVAFATFPTLAACFTKHGELIVHGLPYQEAWTHYQLSHDVNQFIRDVAKEYATDPAYAGKLFSILVMPEVMAAMATKMAIVSA
jgi:flagellar protein FlgJ